MGTHGLCVECVSGGFPLRSPETETLEQWIDRNFSGHGRALRTLQEPPINGEPFMSMEDAKQLLRDGIALFSGGHAPTPDLRMLKVMDAEELPDILTPKAIDQLFARDDLYTARAVFARLRNFGFQFVRAASPDTSTDREGE
jgi:hypothetical protein